MVVGHRLHQDEEEEGEADHEVQQAEVDGAEGAVEGGEGEAEEEEVLVETDEQQVEGSPAKPGVQTRPLPHVAPSANRILRSVFVP